MTDGSSRRGAPDGILIRLADARELAYWTAKLNVNAQQLRDAVKTVGPSAKNVREHLRAQRRER